MRLIHYSDKPIGEIYSTNPGEQGSGWCKPKGLWFSVETGKDDGWKDWCMSEDFNVERLALEHEITLSPSANILKIEHASQLIAFTEKYRINMDGPRYLRDIDWRRVGANFHGIIIAPYIWECRLPDETFWYYGWDCASGCIWDAKAIMSVTPLT